MELIAHRINTMEELQQLPEGIGLELDLRDDLNGRIYIQHEPFIPGEDFEEYLKIYSQRKKFGTMILNVKSERIEFKILELLKKYHVTEYFFLDSSFPMIYLLSKQGEKNCALRISEFEGMDTARNMAGKISWIWVDCFQAVSINKQQLDELKNLGYRLCFVAPELQGRTTDEDFQQFLKEFEENGLSLSDCDAVCTKLYNFHRWQQK